jgi:hypothetical protein
MDMSAVVEYLNENVNISRAWEISEYQNFRIKDSLNYYKLKQNKSWFDKQC